MKRKKIKHVSIIPEEINEKPMKFYDTICYKKKIERNCDFYGINLIIVWAKILSKSFLIIDQITWSINPVNIFNNIIFHRLTIMCAPLNKREKRINVSSRLFPLLSPPLLSTIVKEILLYLNSSPFCVSSESGIGYYVTKLESNEEIFPFPPPFSFHRKI